MLISKDVLTKRLSEAEEAYHRLQIGLQASVFVDQNGERVEYAKVDQARLAAYIAELRRQLTNSNAAGPMHVWM